MITHDFLFHKMHKLKRFLTRTWLHHIIMCRWPSAAVAPDTAFRLACWCRSALFGNDRRVDPGCGTFVGQCSTCCLRRGRGSACCGQALLAIPKSRRSKNEIELNAKQPAKLTTHVCLRVSNEEVAVVPVRVQDRIALAPRDGSVVPALAAQHRPL